ncbi:phage head closure protein [Cytobacillus solani]|uniref:phage head closure protein n=1 Tax=Cytobacillus solani TaxID=1637975 RepID=UPI00207AFE22|nr:phage head closure protein [Cytobacillus solani]USK56573.1 phage head closure protein [Cytobacillus solani]
MQPKYKPKMNSGLFRHYITFQEYDPEAKNENGFPLPEDQRYVDVKSVYAMIKTLSDRGSSYEFYEAATTHSKNTNSFVVRYTTGITSDMRIKYNGHFYEIQSIINDNEMDKTLTIVAREVV